MKLFSSLKKILLNIRLHHKMSSTKYLHLMFNDKFNKPYVDFLYRNYPLEEHLILYKRWTDLPCPTGPNVFLVKKYANLPLESYKGKIICHSLFDSEIVNLFFDKKKLLENACWVVWGGDLYESPTDDINKYVRENFFEYVFTQQGDINALRDKYNIKNCNFKGAFYTFPVTLEMMMDAKLQNTKKNDTTHIQINNSSDKSTISLLDKLARFRENKIYVSTVLSYGDLAYKESIIARGKEIFAEKFTYVDSMMPPQDYANYLASKDILILGQNRQKGGGNFLIASVLGLKTFIRSDVTSFSDYTAMGIKIEDVLKIDNMSFEEFISFDPQTASLNAEIASKVFTDEYLKNYWDCVYDNV